MHSIGVVCAMASIVVGFIAASYQYATLVFERQNGGIMNGWYFARNAKVAMNAWAIAYLLGAMAVLTW